MTRRFSPLVASANAVTGQHRLTFGTRGGGNVIVQTLTYGPSIAMAVESGAFGIVSITNNVAFVFAAPTLDGVAFAAVAPFSSMAGLIIEYNVKNVSGAAHGAGTFNAIFKAAAFPAIANNFQRSFQFMWNGTNFVQLGPRVDVPV